MSPTIDDVTTWKAAYLSLLDSWTALCDLASVEGDSSPAEVLASVRLRAKAEALEAMKVPSGYLLVSEAELATALRTSHRDSRNHGHCSWTSDHKAQAQYIFAALVAAQEKGETGP